MSRKVTLTGGSPWGITLSGGKDFGSHLQISKLTPGGKAMANGVKEKEFILEINGKDTQGVTHHEAQQCIRNTGATLTLTLSEVAPAKSAYHSSSHQPPTATGTQKTQEESRPRPPPPPSPVVTPPTSTKTPPTSTRTPPTTAKVTPPKPVAKADPPPPTYTSQEDEVVFQSPAFKKITSESPSALSPRSVQDEYRTTPPNQQMKQMTIEDGNTRKSTQRPPPPSNTPTTFTATSMKVSSNTGPKGQAPVAKPAPPPSVKRPPPPTASSETIQARTLPSNEPQQAKLTDRQGICEACKQPIRGSYSSAMNKVWHPEHFICFKCRCPLTGGTFVFEEDKIFCNNCYESKVAQMCSLCNKPIVGPMVNATNRYYHQQCFRCSRCASDLSQQDGFNMENGSLFCSGCYMEMYGVTCFGCGQMIGANELWVEALDHNWHPHCFVCDGCKRPLEGSRFFARLGRPYCGQC